MKINGLALDTRQFGTDMLLADVRAVNVYKNGKRTDEIRGYKYTLVLRDMLYERMDVLIDGPQLLDKPRTAVEVSLIGFSPRIAWVNGDYGVSAIATGIVLKGEKAKS